MPEYIKQLYIYQDHLRNYFLLRMTPGVSYSAYHFAMAYKNKKYDNY